MIKRYLKNSQQGMTLIEILIAMVLGSFLLAGVIQIFLSSKQSYRMQENMSRLQENNRFAMEFISQDIRKADYRACYSDASVATAISGTDDSAATPPNLGTDTITVTWKTNACGAANVTSTTKYSIENSANPVLSRSINGGTSEVLVEGIENMQILYGVDSADADHTPDYYTDAGNVVNMAGVVSVRVTITARTADNNLTGTGDGRIRRTVSSTIVLRNRL